LREAIFTANPLNCEWGVSPMTNLGLVIDSENLATPEESAKEMKLYCSPRSKNKFEECGVSAMVWFIFLL